MVGANPLVDEKKESAYEELPDLKGQDLSPSTGVMIEEDYFKSDPSLKQGEQYKQIIEQMTNLSISLPMQNMLAALMT